jgi:hypothetical protein
MRYDPCWGGRSSKPLSKSARKRWERRTKWQPPVEQQAASDSVGVEEVHDLGADLPDPAWKPRRNQAEDARKLLHERARKLWGSPADYRESLQREALEEPELWLATAKSFGGQASSYRQRLNDCRLIERYDAKAEKQVRDIVSVLRRRKSQLVVPFSCDARSMSYFNQRTPTRVWRDQLRGLIINAH